MSNSDEKQNEFPIGDLEQVLENAENIASHSEGKSDTSNSKSTTIQDTGVLNSIQGKDRVDGKLLNSQKIKQGLVPWRDFVPADERAKPNTLLEHLQRAIEDADVYLTEVEELKLEFVYANKKIAIDYFDRWVVDSNMRFRQLASLKKRLDIKRLKKAT